MPKSKRNKLVTLSKAKKKGREHKESLVQTVRQCLEDYSTLYIFAFENMRNTKFKEFRDQLKESSRFFLGSNKVLQIALGRTAAEEAKEDVHKASEMLRGECGLFFTNLPKEKVERLFDEFEEYDFGKAGSVATETIELREGPLEQFSHDMEPFLRKQGMAVRLNRAHLIPSIIDSYPWMQRLLGIQMAAFHMDLICRWSLNDIHIYKEHFSSSDE